MSIFDEYIHQSEPQKREKGYAWQTAIGLQAVDGLTPSDWSKIPLPPLVNENATPIIIAPNIAIQNPTCQSVWCKDNQTSPA